MAPVAVVIPAPVVERLSSLGWCVQCGASYPAKTPEDGLCKSCQRDDDQLYRNEPLPVELPPAPWTRAAMQERLGVCGDEDV